MKKSSTDLKLKKSEILFEDNHLIIINKKPGILVQGDITGDISLIEITKDYIKNKYNKKGKTCQLSKIYRFSLFQSINKIYISISNPWQLYCKDTLWPWELCS